jgi:hypothetical protein
MVVKFTGVGYRKYLRNNSDVLDGIEIVDILS